MTSNSVVPASLRSIAGNCNELLLFLLLFYSTALVKKLDVTSVVVKH